MKNRNCPNCAAPLEIGHYKCPYCGTLYLDLTMIDFDNCTPFFLSIKQNNMIITQKVMPQTASFEHNIDEITYYGGKGNQYLSTMTNNSIETNIQFIAIPFDEKGKTICQVQYHAPVA